MKKIPLMILMLSCMSIFSCQKNNGEEINVNYVNALQSFSSLKQVKDVKPGAPVTLASDNIITIAANEISALTILLNAQARNNTIHVELNSSESLQLVSGNQPQNLNLNKDGYYHLPVSLLAKNNGRYYLHVNVTLNNGEYSSARSLAVIVQVGPLQSNPMSEKVGKPELSNSSGSENIVELPARETISNP